MKNEIEAAKVLLKHSMLLINKTLGITDAMSHNMKLFVSPDNNDKRIDSSDVSVKVYLDGNFGEI